MGNVKWPGLFKYAVRFWQPAGGGRAGGRFSEDRFARCNRRGGASPGCIEKLFGPVESRRGKSLFPRPLFAWPAYSIIVETSFAAVKVSSEVIRRCPRESMKLRPR